MWPMTMEQRDCSETPAHKMAYEDGSVSGYSIFIGHITYEDGSVPKRRHKITYEDGTVCSETSGHKMKYEDGTVCLSVPSS